ncbi:hypothetical protein EVAR_50523_1 [Eumeta japonica]|uniref:Uncharacterized protein n=1 Tax=Eumeta variegata TaxID=151549 RepID=A0A4C1X554_EUMVA|nr:hypothetical protein EVAR_50523_1 [Eumeta japonica]
MLATADYPVLGFISGPALAANLYHSRSRSLSRPRHYSRSRFRRRLVSLSVPIAILSSALFLISLSPPTCLTLDPDRYPVLGSTPGLALAADLSHSRSRSQSRPRFYSRSRSRRRLVSLSIPIAIPSSVLLPVSLSPPICRTLDPDRYHILDSTPGLALAANLPHSRS